MSEIVHLEGLPAVLKMLDAFEGQQLQNKMRVAIRAGAKPFVAALKAEAATAHVPHSFRKVPAAKVSTHGGESGRAVEAVIRPKSPLFNIFEPGARTHTITPGMKGVAAERTTRMVSRAGGFLHHRGRSRGHASGKAALAGPPGTGSWDSVGRKRPADFFSRGPVRHPGMAARPILPAAFALGEPAAVDAIANAIFTLTGGAVE